MIDDKICLLIDDDDEDQELFRMALETVDPRLKFIAISNPEDALDHLKDPGQLPYYIFLDLNMPRMSGKELLQEIRKRDTLSEVPVIIYTTSSHKRDLVESQELGASGYITKPVTVPAMVSILREVFSGRHRF